MSESRLVIIMDDRAWTLAALHLACGMSRRNQTEIVLVKMVPVRHPFMLGTDAGFLDFTSKDAQVLREMTATAEDYGVCLDIEFCQYANYLRAVVDVAEQLAATAVIVFVPPSPLPYWHRFWCWLLRRQLARNQQLLLTLDDLTPSLTWTPWLTMQHDFAVALDQHRIR